MVTDHDAGEGGAAGTAASSCAVSSEMPEVLMSDSMRFAPAASARLGQMVTAENTIKVRHSKPLARWR